METVPLHFAATVVDAHADSVLDVVAGRRRLTRRSPRGHVDFPRLREGGVDVQVFAHWVEPEHKPDRALRRLLVLLDAFLAEVDAAGGTVVVVRSRSDLDAALAARRLAAVIGVEGGEVLHGSLEVLRILFRLGVRVLGLTWNDRNELADGVGEGQAAGGLTRLGVRVVQEMNRLGMVVDVAHLAERGFWDVLEASTRPVIASHAGCRALCDHPRNLSDAQLRGLAQHGGVVGICFYPDFLVPKREEATLRHVADHIDHAVQVAGPDHVGLGSDFDGIDRTPAGLEDVTRLPALTAELERRGYDEATLRKILGENFLRVFRQTWPAA